MTDDGHMQGDGARGAAADRAAVKDGSEATNDAPAVWKAEADGDEPATRETGTADIECASRECEAAAAEAIDHEPETADAPLGAEPSEAPVAGIEDELAEARRAAQENMDRALRVQAELENVRRRMERDLQNAHKFALERFVAELLPVRDSLELGLAASAEKGTSAASITEGVELTLRMLEQAMEKFGVRVVDPAGEPFNPGFHQAMTMQESDAAASGTVLTVVQKGYLLNERLVRPAMVIVAK
ncbi:MAG: nucleotide exchange factor GrpE [Thiotrichales bacterium]|nr:nucleotide exchange factor GrpE [Thiotrichales bacterium]